jgi:hypothetical protein
VWRGCGVQVVAVGEAREPIDWAPNRRHGIDDTLSNFGNAFFSRMFIFVKHDELLDDLFVVDRFDMMLWTLN